MEFIVRVWVQGKTAQYVEYDSLEEAKYWANRFEESYKAKNIDYDILIYEATNY